MEQLPSQMSDKWEQEARLTALQIAFATLVKLQSDDVKNAFESCYQQNTEIWKDSAISFPFPDKWFEMLDVHVSRLQRMISK